MLPIPEDTFVNAKDDEEFRKLLYRLFEFNAECQGKRVEECSARFDRQDKQISAVQRRNWIERAIVAIVGAVAVFLGLKT
jgi:hypothetical protein